MEMPVTYCYMIYAAPDKYKYIDNYKIKWKSEIRIGNLKTTYTTLLLIFFRFTSITNISRTR